VQKLQFFNFYSWVCLLVCDCATEMGTEQRCAGEESTPARVSVFQQEPEQDQESVFLTGTGAEVILSRDF